MRFGRVSFIHRAQVRVAAHLDLFQLLLVVENCGERVAAHDVLFLFRRRAARESQAHRRLLEDRLRRMNCDRLRARAFQWFGIFFIRIFERFGRYGDFDVVAQLKPLVLIVDQRSGRFARNVFTLEGDRRRRLGDFVILMIDQRIGFHFQSLVSFDLHVAGELSRSLLLVINGPI